MIEQDFPVHWYHLIAIGIIIIGTVVLTRVIRWLINKQLEKDSPRFAVDQTRFAFFKNALSLFIWIIALIAIIYTIPPFRNLAITLLTGAGIMVAIAGLAAQQAFSNIISGIFIVIFKPFRVGDLIRVGQSHYGIVEDITLRHTVIQNFENKRVIVPNAVISADTVINESIVDSKVCRFIEYGISYDSDIDLAISIIQDVAMHHKYFFDNRTKAEKKSGLPAVVIRVSSFGDSSVNLKALVWTRDPLNAFEMHSDINKEVKRRFDNEGVEIPFPYRTVVFKKDMKTNMFIRKDDEVKDE